MDLATALEKVQNVSDKNLHLNIVNSQNYELAQLFNVIEFNSWDTGVKFEGTKGAVLSLNFVDDGPERLFFEKFKSSKFYSKFKRANENFGLTFFYFIEEANAHESLNKLNEILFSVYGNLSANKFELNSY